MKSANSFFDLVLPIFSPDGTFSSAWNSKSLDRFIVEKVKKITEGKQPPVIAYPPDMQDYPIAIKLLNPHFFLPSPNEKS